MVRRFTQATVDVEIGLSDGPAFDSCHSRQVGPHNGS